MNSYYYKCRLCLKLGDFCSIFEKDEAIKLSEMVMSFANIKIIEGDGLSDRVCSSCIENLSTAYLFKIQCEKIDSQLRTNGERHVQADYNGLLKKDFYMHTDCGLIQENNDENSVKDANIQQNNIKGETSDDTDSDIDSIKCVYCNESYNSFGAHQCQVTCTIESNNVDSTGSDETLVAEDMESQFFSANSTLVQDEVHNCKVSCVLCDNKYQVYREYVDHVNMCTANVKLHYFVCPLCHEMNTEKDAYLEHLKLMHFKQTSPVRDIGIDCVDTHFEKPQKKKTARRQIGWSVEDIYQEIEFQQKEDKTPTSSPLKNFFTKHGNESFGSRQSTPRKVTFQKLISNGKAMTSNYLPFKRYIQNYKLKKKEALYSPVIPKSQRNAKLKITKTISDSDYGTSSTSEDSWKLKQNLICACDKKVFMLSEFLDNRQRVVSMITDLGGVVAENTKMEMLATHFISTLPKDAYTGMMVCALGTGKWLLNLKYIYDSFRGNKFLNEKQYEWSRQPKIPEMDNTCVQLAEAATYWHYKLQTSNSKMPFEGMQVVLVMKKKYRQYYQMLFKTLKARALAYDPRIPGGCCNADYCFVDMKVIERVKLGFFATHNIPVFPYQYILIYLLNRGCIEDEDKYLLQDSNMFINKDTIELLNKTF